MGCEGALQEWQLNLERMFRVVFDRCHAKAELAVQASVQGCHPVCIHRQWAEGCVICLVSGG
jgi:hypothetical protein